MTNSLREKLLLIFKATRQHARNLATFATIYKTSLLCLRHLTPFLLPPSSTTPVRRPHRLPKHPLRLHAQLRQRQYHPREHVDDYLLVDGTLGAAAAAEDGVAAY